MQCSLQIQEKMKISEKSIFTGKKLLKFLNMVIKIGGISRYQIQQITEIRWNLKKFENNNTAEVWTVFKRFM